MAGPGDSEWALAFNVYGTQSREVLSRGLRPGAGFFRVPPTLRRDRGASGESPVMVGDRGRGTTGREKTRMGPASVLKAELRVLLRNLMWAIRQETASRYDSEILT